mgnify:CR=1 FL=1
MSLSEFDSRDRAILEFAKLRWKHLGAKDTAILVLFGLTPIAYSQVLMTAIDKPGAEEYDAEFVHRLRRLRDARRVNRAARMVGFEIS